MPRHATVTVPTGRAATTNYRYHDRTVDVAQTRIPPVGGTHAWQARFIAPWMGVASRTFHNCPWRSAGSRNADGRCPVGGGALQIRRQRHPAADQRRTLSDGLAEEVLHGGRHWRRGDG